MQSLNRPQVPRQQRRCQPRLLRCRPDSSLPERSNAAALAACEAACLLLQWLQYAIWERHKVRTVRRTLGQLAEQGSLDSSGNLSVQGQPIAVCYYRAGYAPTDYPSDAEWRARSAHPPALPNLLHA